MGRLRNLAQAFHEFATTHVEESDVPAVADGDDGYNKAYSLDIR
jgi:IS5 family transposase